MGYRIEYQPGMKLRRQMGYYPRRAILTVVFLSIFLITVVLTWPRGKEVLKRMLFSGDIAVTAAALEDMTSDLQAGMPFSDALEEFCVHVITESEFADN